MPRTQQESEQMIEAMATIVIETRARLDALEAVLEKRFPSGLNAEIESAYGQKRSENPIFLNRPDPLKPGHLARPRARK